MDDFENSQIYDHSFSRETLLSTLCKSDFYEMRALHDESIKLSIIDAGVESAHNLFAGASPLVRFPLNGNQIYKINNLSNELAVRKLYYNIEQLVSFKSSSRDTVVSNLHRLISEGVPYRLYRLDIKKFYESFTTLSIEERLYGLPGLSPPSKALLHALLDSHVSSGGLGLPRGLALSALISEIMMQDFDLAVRSMSGVYFFSRYVDDIVILTNCLEHPKVFLRNIIQHLPEGLTLHERKRQICHLYNKVSPTTVTPTIANITFDYLGYAFAVYEPIKEPGKKNGHYFRKVHIDIATSKLQRIKTRIVRSMLNFSASGDFDLLYSRVKFLTSNFSITDFRRDRSKLAGIYYSYPEITDPLNSGLQQLDNFLVNAVLSKSGRVFSKSGAELTASQRRLLLKHSFTRGYIEKTMVHFHPKRIRKIQECWLYE